MSIKTDVLICGSGSAGVCAAVWLSRLGVDFRIIDKRDGPLKVGQADGVQCRTVEVFESFGLDEELKKDAYWVNEVVFWTINSNGNTIAKTKRTADVPPGLSWQPHVILNQARLNGLLLEEMKRASGKQVDYALAIKEVKVDSSLAHDREAYPIFAIAENEHGEQTHFEAKYLLGCDGAHSAVRKSLGYKMVGDSSDAVWGVMDIFPQTDFPDIRKKTSIKSAAGNLLIIPREGGSMVRFYIELPLGTVPRNVTLEDIQAAARKIFSQYSINFADTFWWSAYSIGQRLADHFSKENRVFLTGDACHTHSPKAGQGMNLSLQDGYNIGWKLASVLKGTAGPELLKTYNIEREKTASDLIAFDREITQMLSSKQTKSAAETAVAYSDHFIKSARYMAGLTTTYADTMITDAKASTQTLAKNITVGMRFPSVQVVRFFDVRAVQLSRALQSDGRWRLMVFSGNVLNQANLARLDRLAEFLTSPKSPIVAFTKKGASSDSLIEPLLVMYGERVKIEDDGIPIPAVFTPVNGKWQMKDLNKIYVDDESYNNGHGKAYEKLGIDPEKGAVVVIRPDQHVSLVVSLEDHEIIDRFITGALKSSISNGV